MYSRATRSFRSPEPCGASECGTARCRRRFPAGERQGKAAAFNQKNIRPALPEPGEFDDFWRGGLAEVAAVPPDIRQKRIEALCDGRREVYRLSFATVGGGGFTAF